MLQSQGKNNKYIIESLTRASFSLYVEKDFDNALFITDKISDIPFNNDYDYWTWIELALSLRTQISIIKGDEAKVRDSIRLINEALDYGDSFHKKIKSNVHKRFLTCEDTKLNY